MCGTSGAVAGLARRAIRAGGPSKDPAAVDVGSSRAVRRARAVCGQAGGGVSAARYAQLLVPMLWLGMVVAISFLEAPIKFRAPGVTLPVGLGIGRLVFKALNGVEIALLLLLGVSCYVV